MIDAALRASLHAAIGAKAEQQRLAIITAGSGKAMSYLEKASEAKEVMANLTAVQAMTAEEQQTAYPVLYSEVGVRADTLIEMAQLVIGLYRQFQLAEAAINGAEARAKAAVDAAETEGEAVAVVRAYAWSE